MQADGLAIVVEGLAKRYGSVSAVDGVDLRVRVGEVFALLGPNGAGKTTTVEILEGHRTRSGGSVEVLGHDPETAGRRYRERIGIVLQSTAVEQELSVAEALDVYGAMYLQRRPTDELIEIVGLTEKRDARVKTLSGGQRRRLELALGLVGDPELLFLDEPTTGFDPSARRQAWSVIDNLRSLGTTILLTTHYMDEAQHLSDRLAVIAAGKIVAEGTPQTIGGRSEGVSIVRFHRGGLDLSSMPIPDATLVGGDVEVRSHEPTKTLHALTGWALGQGAELAGLVVERPSLEDVYLQLAGEGDGLDA